MKVFLVFLFMMPSCLFAQDDYRPVLEQGKEWHYTYNNYFTGKRYTFYEYIEGDSIVEGRTYKKLRTPEGVSCLREEGAKVYLLDNNGHSNRETLLYDFTIREGDLIDCSFEEMELFVSSIDVLDTPEGKYMCWLINEIVDPDMNPPLEVWVEGVGSLSGLTNVFGNHLAGNFISFDYCKFPDGTVFRSSDFTSSIDNISASPVNGNVIYDLSGRRLTAEPKQGMYIRNGKKVVKVKN